ncbi:MAG: hypothetical protein AAF602_23730 [Myxococcota bacterium]
MIVEGETRSEATAAPTIEPMAPATRACEGCSTTWKLSPVLKAGMDTSSGARSAMGSGLSDPRPSRWLRPWSRAPGHSSSTSGLYITMRSGVSVMV